MKKKNIMCWGITVIAMTVSLSAAVYAADGWQKNDAGQWTYYENDKPIKKQWIQDAEGHWSYINNNGIMMSNASANVNGVYYFFDKNGFMEHSGWCAAENTNATTGRITYTWYYANDDGTLYCDGWKTVNDVWFYFTKDGRATRGGVVTIGEKKYYIDKDKGCLGIGGGWFSVDAERALPTDPVRTTWYYSEADGALFYDGWKTIDGGDFYFTKSGTVIRNGLITVEEKKYYIDQERGCLGEGGGWFSVDTVGTNGVTITRNYYANADASLLYNGWYVVDGVRQYFDNNGMNYKNRWFTLDDQKIYVDETGAQQQPGWFSVSNVNSNGVEYMNWYYLNPDYTVMPEGFQEMDGHIYYFDKNGLNYRKRWYVDAEKNRFYLDENGYLQNNGWFSISTTNAKTGIVSVAWYYANPDGSCLLNGFHTLDGKDYYFSDAGVSFRKRWLQDNKNRRRYFNDEGYMEKSNWFATESTSTITGPVTVGMDEEEITTTKLTWYYADENGYIVTEGNINIGGQEYKLNKNGTMFTGWSNIKGSQDYYYYKEDGSKALGWQLITNPNQNETMYHIYTQKYGDLCWFYFDPNANGCVVHSGSSFGENTIDGRIYGMNKRGMVQYGWANYKSGTDIKSFHYYMPVETGGVSTVTAGSTVNGDELHNQGKDGYLPGERVANAWVWAEAPYQVESANRDATWYYLRGDGIAEHADKGKIQLKNIDGYHAFDPDGRTYSGFGFKQGRNEEIKTVYYFDVNNHNAAVTGVREIDVNGTTETFKFNEKGEGVTGVYDGYLYYRGRRQAGAGIRGVSYDANEGKSENVRMVSYLVDSTGKLVLNADNLESNGSVWSSSAAGLVTGSSGDIERARTVSWEDVSVHIGEVND